MYFKYVQKMIAPDNNLQVTFTDSKKRHLILGRAKSEIQLAVEGYRIQTAAKLEVRRLKIFDVPRPQTP